MAGPLAYRVLCLDKRTLAGVFLGWDVGAPEFEKPVLTEKEVERLDDTGGVGGARSGLKRDGTVRKLAKRLLAGIGKSKGVNNGQGGNGKAQSKTGIKAKKKGRDRPHAGTNFKAPLLRLVKVLTITEHHPHHCQHLADTAVGALISLDILRIVPPKYDHLTSFKQLCKGYRLCPLLGCFDTKKIVFRNINGSGFPFDRVDARSWSPPSLQEVVRFLTTDESLNSLLLDVELRTIFPKTNKIKMVFLMQGQEPTGTDRPYLRHDGMTMDQLGTLDASTFVRLLSGQGNDRDIPAIYAPAFFRIVTGVLRPGRALEIFGVENVRFDSFHPPQPYETEDAASQDVVTRVCEALRKANVTLEGNTEANLVIGSIDEYWARGDWIGEVNSQEITQRIRTRQWARRDARRDTRWMAVRDDLHREYKAGNFQCDSWPGRWLPNEADFSDDGAPYWFYQDDPEGMDSDDEVTF
jgi:hypothetical protein